jgi:hypothetical protein
MTLAWIRRVFCLAGIALGFAAAYACSLNPQPLPPGETADASDTVVGHDASTFGPGADSGGSFAGDGPTGGAVPDGSSDGAVPGPPEGGDAADAGDSETQVPTDGATDAPDGMPADAPTDGEEGGG